MSSPNSFKYRFFHKGDWIYGNSIDSIASSLSKIENIPFTKAVVIVSSSMIPVSRTILDQKISSKENTQKKLRFTEIAAGATSAMKQISGFTESQDVINRRSIACSSCPKKSAISGCMSCGFASKLVKWANGVKKMFKKGHTIPNGLDKAFCECCDCSLAMMLPATISDFKESTINDENRPETCWLKIESKA